MPRCNKKPYGYKSLCQHFGYNFDGGAGATFGAFVAQAQSNNGSDGNNGKIKDKIEAGKLPFQIVTANPGPDSFEQ